MGQFGQHGIWCNKRHNFDKYHQYAKGGSHFHIALALEIDVEPFDHWTNEKTQDTSCSPNNKVEENKMLFFPIIVGQLGHVLTIFQILIEITNFGNISV